MADITRILESARRGEPGAMDTLLPLIYAELREMARQKLAEFPNERTLQPTALVHEAYLRLVGQSGWENRGHFFSSAARAMWQILVEKARAKKALKRGGAQEPLGLDDLDLDQLDVDLGAAGSGDSSTDLLVLDDALDALGRDTRPAQVTLLRFVAGLTVDEIAAALEISVSSVERDWRFARAFLYQHIEGSSP